MKKTATEELIDQTEAMCKVFVGPHAPSEQWTKTCERFIALDKLVKKIRREQKAAAKKEAAA